MEPSQSNKLFDTLAEVKVGLSQYYENRSKLEIWTKIFWILSVYIGKDGTLCLEGQKIVNYYLQNKSELSQLGSLVSQNKQLICKIIQICLSTSESVDWAISTGALSETLSKKLIKSSDQNSRWVFKLVNFCAHAVAIHFCEFLRKFRDGNASHIILTNRKRSKIIKRKFINVSSTQQLCQQMFGQPVVLLQGFLDLLKPMISNNLNIESLFQVTSPFFKSKKAFLSYNIEQPNSKPQFNGKILKLNNIFDSTHAGREMIETRLRDLSAQTQLDVSYQYWSIVSCLMDQQSTLLHICEHLPQFLRPKSNGDILSYSRMQYFPTFKYMVSKSGYTSKPILSQFVTVMMNVGKKSIDLICFSNKSGVNIRVRKEETVHRGKNMQNWLDGCGIQYMKVRILPRNIAVISSNTFYVVVSDFEEKETSISQLIFWNVLPKFHDCVKATICAFEQKKKAYKSYWWMPLEQIFLDYLNHEYLISPQLQTIHEIKSYLQVKLERQEQMLISLRKKYPQISIGHVPPAQSNAQITSNNRQSILCSTCHQFFINYYCKTSRRQSLCMNCAAYCGFDSNSIEEFVVLHRPLEIRYPLTLANLYITKRKCPGQSIENVYEKNICPGKFIGATSIENCKLDSEVLETSKINKSKQFLQKTQMFLSNYQKQLGVASTSDLLISLAVQQTKDEAQIKSIVEKMQILVKQIEDPEQLLKQIMPKFSLNNLIAHLMWIFKQRQINSENN